MDAAAISNVPLANVNSVQARASAVSVVPGNAVALATPEAKQPANFAQIVREIMVRTTTENPIQQVRPLKTGASLNSKATALAPLATPNSVTALSPAASSAPNSVDVTTLGLFVASTSLPLTEQLQLPAPTVNSSVQATLAGSNATVQIGEPSKQIDAPPNQLTNTCATSAQSLMLHTALNATIFSVGSTDTATNSANSQLAPGAQSQQPANSTQQLPASPASADPLLGVTNGVRVTTNTGLTSQGEPFSSVLQQVAQLQSPDTNSSVTVSSNPAEDRQSSARPQLTQTAMKSTLAAIALTDAKPIPAVQSSSIPKLEVALAETAHAASSPATVPSTTANHSDARDASSNQGGQSSSDLLSSKGQTSPTQGSPDFLQTFSSASNTKADPTPAASSSASVVSTPPITTPSEHTSTTATLAAPSPAPSQTSLNPANSDPDNTRVINDAQLVQAGGHSEMRIAMQTEKLGAIELHARVTGDEVGAAITVEKRDAHTALSIELPALQQALTEKQLRVDQIALMQGSLSSTAGGSSAYTQQGEHGASQRPQLNNFSDRSSSLSSAASLLTTEQTGAFDSQGRLSVHA